MGEGEGLPPKGDALRRALMWLSEQRRTGLAHVLLGSVAERVVRQAPMPVITVRPSKKG